DFHAAGGDDGRSEMPVDERNSGASARDDRLQRSAARGELQAAAADRRADRRAEHELPATAADRRSASSASIYDLHTAADSRAAIRPARGNELGASAADDSAAGKTTAVDPLWSAGGK